MLNPIYYCKIEYLKCGIFMNGENNYILAKIRLLFKSILFNTMFKVTWYPLLESYFNNCYPTII